MHAIVQSIGSPDLDNDGIAFHEGFESYPYLMQIEVGSSEGEGVGGEVFYVLVYTLDQLKRALQAGPMIGRHAVLTAEIDVAETQRFLTRSIEALEASSWLELAAKISEIACSEFEQPGSAGRLSDI